MKRLQDSYVPSPRKAFSGQGQRLGSPAPGASSSSSTSEAIPGSFPTGTAGGSSLPAQRSAEDFGTRFAVDQTKPATSVQIRLADGTRMVARMNLTHTVGDIRNFINAYVLFHDNQLDTYRSVQIAPGESCASVYDHDNVPEQDPGGRQPNDRSSRSFQCRRGPALGMTMNQRWSCGIDVLETWHGDRQMYEITCVSLDYVAFACVLSMSSHEVGIYLYLNQ